MPTLQEHLLALSTGAVQPEAPHLGICYELYRRRYFESPALAELWVGNNLTDWPKFSGRRLYPIPSQDGAHWAFKNSNNLWADDQYGDDRRKACAYLAGKCDA